VASQLKLVASQPIHFVWSKAVKIYLNGELREFAEGLTIDALISTLGLEPTRVAIELNRHVVRRNDWQSAVLHHEDRVEIVHFVGGGGPRAL
jgi:thiazole synthase